MGNFKGRQASSWLILIANIFPQKISCMMFLQHWRLTRKKRWESHWYRSGKYTRASYVQPLIFWRVLQSSQYSTILSIHFLSCIRNFSIPFQAKAATWCWSAFQQILLFSPLGYTDCIAIWTHPRCFVWLEGIHGYGGVASDKSCCHHDNILPIADSHGSELLLQEALHENMLMCRSRVEMWLHSCLR